MEDNQYDTSLIKAVGEKIESIRKYVVNSRIDILEKLGGEAKLDVQDY